VILSPRGENLFAYGDLGKSFSRYQQKPLQDSLDQSVQPLHGPVWNNNYTIYGT